MNGSATVAVRLMGTMIIDFDSGSLVGLVAKGKARMYASYGRARQEGISSAAEDVIFVFSCEI